MNRRTARDEAAEAAEDYAGDGLGRHLRNRG